MRSSTHRSPSPAFGLLIVATVVAIVSGDRLSSREDLRRSQQCGRPVTEDVTHWTTVSGRDAPWLAQINYEDGGSLSKTSGFYISDRHIVTSSDTFLDHQASNFTWLVGKRRADVTTCQKNVMVVPQFVLNNVTVHSCVGAKSGENCLKSAALRVVGANYVGNCDNSLIAYGMVVLELAEPVTSITPLCIPKSHIEKIGETLVATAVHLEEGIASRPVKVVDECVAMQGHKNLSICLGETGSCSGDFGGPVVKHVDGQQYAVAVLWSDFCKGTWNKHISTGALSSALCKVSGVCRSQYPTPTTA